MRLFLLTTGSATRFVNSLIKHSAVARECDRSITWVLPWGDTGDARPYVDAPNLTWGRSADWALWVMKTMPRLTTPAVLPQVNDETHEKCPRNTLRASRRNARETVSIVRHGK